MSILEGTWHWIRNCDRGLLFFFQGLVRWLECILSTLYKATLGTAFIMLISFGIHEECRLPPGGAMQALVWLVYDFVISVVM